VVVVVVGWVVVVGGVVVVVAGDTEVVVVDGAVVTGAASVTGLPSAMGSKEVSLVPAPHAPTVRANAAMIQPVRLVMGSSS
jgi:hypothetical protein